MSYSTTDPYHAVRRRVAKLLVGFTPSSSAMSAAIALNAYRPEPRKFPVPGLVLFTLRNLMGWPWQGKGEKVRWTLYGSVSDEPIEFELRKFGFTIIHREGAAKKFLGRVEGQLQRALKEVEKFLEPLAQEQIERGAASVANRAHEFEQRYRFFRDMADAIYRKAAEGPVGRRTGLSLDLLVADYNGGLVVNREGFFHSTAMVDCYFSALEHRLVLLRAFTGQPLGNGELRQLLASKWDEKLKMVLPVPHDHQTGLLLGRMRRIKERIRNPFAHGGIENDGGSIFFHMPDIGAIPANFTRFGDSVRFSFIPIAPDDHAESCAVFDDLDALLMAGPLAGPHMLVSSGIDPAFDADSLQEYATAVAGGDAALEAFIVREADEWERHVNMDY